MRHPSKRKTSFSLSPLVGILAVLILAGLFARTSWTYRAAEESTAQQKAHILSRGEKEGDVLDRIAACESGDRHFDDKGQVVRGVQNNQDVGRYQINLYWHAKTAKAMNLNLFNEKDNRTYAEWLYAKEGGKPWSWSFKCHGVK